MGYETVPIVRRRCVLEGKIIHFLETRSFAVIDLLKILRHIVLANRKTSAFLTLTFGGKLAPYELLISVIVRMLGLKTVTYMQGGQFIDFYNLGGQSFTVGSSRKTWTCKARCGLRACPRWKLSGA